MLGILICLGYLIPELQTLNTIRYILYLTKLLYFNGTLSFFIYLIYVMVVLAWCKCVNVALSVAMNSSKQVLYIWCNDN